MHKNLNILFFVMIVLSFISKISGLAREVVTGYFFGATAKLDVFYFTYTIPELLVSGITATLAVVLVPLLSKDEEVLSQSNNKFISQILAVGTGFFLLLLLACFSMQSWIVKAIYNEFDHTVDKHTVFLILSVSLMQVLPIFISSVYLGIETKLERFKVITLLSIPLNIVSVGTVVFFHGSMGIMSLGIGLLFGILLQMVYLMWDIRKLGYRFSFHAKLLRQNKGPLLEFMAMFFPVYFGTVIQRTNVFTDRFLASSMGEGSVSALSYADRLIQMIVMIVVTTIGMIMFSKFTSADSDRAREEMLSKTLIFSFVLIMPLTCYILVYGKDLITVIFDRGQFQQHALHLTTLALIGYSIGLIGITLRYLFNRVYFAQNDVRTPTRNTITYCFVNLLLSISLGHFFHVFGLALAASATMILSSATLAWDLEKKYGFLGKIKWDNCIKAVGISAALLLYWKTADEWLLSGMPSAVRLVLSAGSGGMFFMILLSVCKVEGFDFYRLAKRKRAALKIGGVSR